MRRSRGGFSFKCLTCGTIVEKKYYNKKLKYLYCSRQCAGMQNRGKDNVRYRGPQKSREGYVLIPQVEGNPRARRDGSVLEHTLVAERVIGHYLPPNAVVHHVNEARWDNRPNNLVICQDERYHRLLHVRMKRKETFGSPNLKQCEKCRAVKNLIDFAENEHSVDGKDKYCLLCFKPKKDRRITHQLLKDHCKRGHLHNEENTRIRTDGNKYCLVCKREDNMKFLQKRRELST